MPAELRYTTFQTDMGWVGILGSINGLRCTTLPQPSSHEAQQLLGSLSDAIWAPHFFDDLIQRLRVYFGGHEATFLDRLDMYEATAFQRRVWEKTRLISYGETRSYSWVAEQMGKPQAVRAVGQALGRNPLPIIIPCHRVIAINEKLGGFSGGVEWKRSLLDLEVTCGI